MITECKKKKKEKYTQYLLLNLMTILKEYYKFKIKTSSTGKYTRGNSYPKEIRETIIKIKEIKKEMVTNQSPL